MTVTSWEVPDPSHTNALQGDASVKGWCIVDPGNRTAGRTPLWGVWIAVVKGVCE